MTRDQVSTKARPPRAADGAESQIRNEELYRMAAFRIRETAKRIAKLANSAHDQNLRAELLVVYERLLEDERALLEMSEKG